MSVRLPQDGEAAAAALTTELTAGQVRRRRRDGVVGVREGAECRGEGAE